MTSLRLGACSGDEFVVWKKEICALVIDDLNGDTLPMSKFTRLEFHEDLETLELDWLEPTIHDNNPALILYCHRI